MMSFPVVASKDDISLVVDCLASLGDGAWPQVMAEKGRVQCIWVWGRAQGENGAVLPLAASLYHQTGAKIVIPGYVGSKKSQGETGYAGPDAWRNELMKFDVPESMILATAGAADKQHTVSEFLEFLDWLGPKPTGYPILAVTTVVHVLRAMLGAVHCLWKRDMLPLTVLPVWQDGLDFTTKVHGSQGKGPLSYYDWIKEELDRLPIYQSQDDLGTSQHLLSYMRSVRLVLNQKYPTSRMQLAKYLQEFGRAIVKPIR